jgi:hypothetical protein
MMNEQSEPTKRKEPHRQNAKAVTKRATPETNGRHTARGPQTEADRQAVRTHAYKHGMAAVHFPIVLHPAEDADAYQELHQQLLRYLRPIGPVEEFLVVHLGDKLWLLLQRINRAERAVIAHRQYQLDRHLDRQFHDDQLDDPQALLKTSRGLAELVDLVDDVIAEMMQSGDDFVDVVAKLPEYVATELPPASALAKLPSPAARKAAVIDALKGCREDLLSDQVDLRDRENHILENKRGRRMLPDERDTDRILRYRVATERAIDRILKQLAKLQKGRRHGDAARDSAGLTIALKQLAASVREAPTLVE